MITVTENAKNKITDLIIDNKESYLRISVQGGGCSGFTYNYEFVDGPEAGDFEIDLLTCKFVVDSMSLVYVAGTELDYEQDLSGSRLSLVNPNEKNSCGCGKSFSV